MVAIRSDSGILFLSTPSARRATVDPFRRGGCRGISIHALREEGDDNDAAVFRQHGEFLSTPSARRATSTSIAATTRLGDFYPRPPRGGRPLHGTGIPDTVRISIHALREEGDSKNRDKISIFL